MRLNKILFLFICLVLANSVSARHKHPGKHKHNQKPVLVVGIVVDQMKFDYLQRFRHHFGANGFNRLMREGSNCTNTFYNYIPTYTAPGHASIFTGTTPAFHGIAGNDWYDYLLKKETYCVSDTTVSTIGSSTKAAGQMSPKNLLATTISDEIKLANNNRSKTIGIALKDRGAILPAGHLANAAYWFDGASGNWISSTYYMDRLPEWVQSFNNQRLADKYAHTDWNLSQPLYGYVNNDICPDSNQWENKFVFDNNSAFPHHLSRNATLGAEIIRATPFGNHLTRQLAIAALQNEQLGSTPHQTDFLSISFSSTDYVGHLFGPSSLEIEDTYIQLDQDIDSLLTYLDRQYGREHVLVFLTADHGASDVPGFLQAQRLPGGVIKTKAIIDSLKSYLNQRLGKGDWIINYENQQIFLNRTLIANRGLEARFVSATINSFFDGHVFEGLERVIDLRNQGLQNLPTELRDKISLGIFPNRSGDLVLIFRPNWIENMEKGTSHGAAYSYDTHVPLLWWGAGIPRKIMTNAISICDIAPTLSAHLRTPLPSAVIGKPINFGQRVKQAERSHKRKRRK